MECAVLGNAEPQASLVGEIIPQKDFYSYEAKYMNESDAVLRMPTDLTSEEESLVQKTACEVFRILGLRGLARIDMFLDTKGKLWVNEVNTMPGFTNISMYPGLWEKGGLPLSLSSRPFDQAGAGSASTRKPTQIEPMLISMEASKRALSAY